MSFFIDPWLFNCAEQPGRRAGRAARAADDHRGDAPRPRLRARPRRDPRRRARQRAPDLGRVPTSTTPARTSRPATSKPRDVDNACLDMPTEGNDVISVSSVGPSKAKADYSNYGLEQNDVAAPGGYFRDFFGTPHTGYPRTRSSRPTRRASPSPPVRRPRDRCLAAHRSSSRSARRRAASSRAATTSSSRAPRWPPRTPPASPR